MNDDGTMKRAPELREFADEHGLAMISIDDLVRFRRRHERHVERVAETRLPTRHGEFTAYGYRITIDDSEHVALAYGDIVGAAQSGEPVLTRVHSECLTGDVFGSERCDCGPQLDEALRSIVAEGGGGGLPARPRGPRHRPRRQAAGLPAPGRRSRHRRRQPRPGPARGRPPLRHGDQVLRDLGIESVRLMTNNPDKTASTEDFGIRVAERVPLTIRPTKHNLAYLRTKADRMGHHLPPVDLPRLRSTTRPNAPSSRENTHERRRSTHLAALRRQRPEGRGRRGELAPR